MSGDDPIPGLYVPKSSWSLYTPSRGYSMGITTALVPAGAHQGRAIGALVMTAFGAIWMISGATALSLLNWEIWLIVAILTGLLCVAALLELQAARRIPTTPATASQSKSIQTRRRRFGIVLAFEWVPIFLVAFVLGRIGHPDFILPAIAVIVGLHFIPLARLFNCPLYYWTGISFVLVAIGSFAIDPLAIRQAITCLGCGLALWLTTAVLVFRK
jgi:MFS family permease